MRQITYVVILLFIIPYSVYSQSIPDIEKLLETNDIDSSEDYYEDMINPNPPLRATDKPQFSRIR